MVSTYGGSESLPVPWRAATMPGLDNLDDAALTRLLQLLPAQSLTAACQASKRLSRLCSQQQLWRYGARLVFCGAYE